MLISRTPFRVSLFGGGTDIPEFFLKEGGEVVSFSIDKYCYVTVRDLPPFFDHKIRIAYSKLESCKNIDEIEHPLVRAALKDFNISNVEIHYDSDLPGRSGIGSSSSFAVGLANCLYGLKNDFKDKKDLANKAIYWERIYLKEQGGFQDQIAASYGGLNFIEFNKNNTFHVNPLNISKDLLKEMNERMFLCYIPNFRLSNEVSVQNFIKEKNTIKKLKKIKEFVRESVNLLKSGDLDSIGYLLDEAWVYKRSLNKVTSQDIDEIYGLAKKAGVLGGKILGAGSGGFMLFWCKEGSKKSIMKKLNISIKVNFEIDHEGTRIIYNNKETQGF